VAEVSSPKHGGERTPGMGFTRPWASELPTLCEAMNFDWAWLGLPLPSRLTVTARILLLLGVASNKTCRQIWSCVVSRSRSVVSKIREEEDRDVYLVLDSFGDMGLAWRQTVAADTARATLVRDLLDGQYEDPVRIVAFNTTEGWSRDVTEEIADELEEYCADLDEIPAYLQDFLERHPNGSK